MPDDSPARGRKPFFQDPFSTTQALFGATFLALLSFRYLFFPFFHDYRSVDGAFEYAFTRLLMNGKFLGVDYFFTYGPLAQYLGPLIEPGQKTPWIGWAFKFSILLAYGLCAWDLYALVRSFGAKRSIPFLLLILAGLSLCPGLQPQEETPYNILIFLTYLNFHWTYGGHAARNRYLYLLLFLAVTLTLFKFSLGLHALAVLGLIAIFWSFREGWKGPALLGIVWAGGETCLFRFLTGHWNIARFWGFSWGITSAYSETAAFDPSTGFLTYPMGFLSVACFLGLGALWAEQYLRDRSSKISLVACFGLTGFIFFKLGFVRADLHTLRFYQTILPLTVLLAGLLLANGLYSRKGCWAALMFLLISLQVGCSQWGLSTGSGPLTLLRQTVQESWVQEPRFILRYWNDPQAMCGIFEAERRSYLLNQYPKLCFVLDHLSREKPGRTIAFAPWNMVIASVLPGLTLVSTPSLQNYNAAAQPGLSQLDEACLSSNDGPDLLVLSPDVFDKRNFLSDYSYWVDPLFRHYHSLGTFDGQVVLSRDRSPTPDSVRCSPSGPGLFLRLQARPLGVFQNFVFSLGKLLFKPPELTIRVEALDSQGEQKVILSEGYYSQLKQGVYFSDRPVVRIWSPPGPDLSPLPCIQEIKSAVAIRKPGLENLPLLPERIPLEVEYCSPLKDPCGN